MKATKVLLAALLFGTVVTSGCGPGATGDAFFNMNNDSYDSVDVYIGGVYSDTVPAGDTHSYDLGVPGVYNIQLTKSGEINTVLNNDDVFMDAGITSWDVYDNAPVVTIINDTASGNDEAIDLSVDGQNVQFAIETNSVVAFDSTLLVGETGFYLVDIGDHTIDIFGNATNAEYANDTRTYIDGTHLTYTAQ